VEEYQVLTGEPKQANDRKESPHKMSVLNEGQTQSQANLRRNQLAMQKAPSLVNLMPNSQI